MSTPDQLENVLHVRLTPRPPAWTVSILAAAFTAAVAFAFAVFEHHADLIVFNVVWLLVYASHWFRPATVVDSDGIRRPRWVRSGALTPWADIDAVLQPSMLDQQPAVLLRDGRIVSLAVDEKHTAQIAHLGGKPLRARTPALPPASTAWSPTVTHASAEASLQQRVDALTRQRVVLTAALDKAAPPTS